MGNGETAVRGGRIKATQDWLSRSGRYPLGPARAAVVPRLLRGQPQLGVCGYRLLVALGLAGRAGGRRPVPLLGKRHERLRGASDLSPEPDRVDRQPRPGHLRQRLFQQAGGDDHGGRQLPDLGDRNRPDLPGRLRPCLAGRGRLGSRPGAVRDLLLRHDRRDRARRRLRRGTPRYRLVRSPAGLAGGLDRFLALGAALPAAPEGRRSAPCFPARSLPPSCSAAPPLPPPSSCRRP